MWRTKGQATASQGEQHTRLQPLKHGNGKHRSQARQRWQPLARTTSVGTTAVGTASKDDSGGNRLQARQRGKHSQALQRWKPLASTTAVETARNVNLWQDLHIIEHDTCTCWFQAPRQRAHPFSLYRHFEQPCPVLFVFEAFEAAFEATFFFALLFIVLPDTSLQSLLFASSA